MVSFNKLYEKGGRKEGRKEGGRKGRRREETGNRAFTKSRLNAL